jgi:hypothetical protein
MGVPFLAGCAQTAGGCEEAKRREQGEVPGHAEDKQGHDSQAHAEEQETAQAVAESGHNSCATMRGAGHAGCCSMFMAC